MKFKKYKRRYLFLQMNSFGLFFVKGFFTDDDAFKGPQYSITHAMYSECWGSDSFVTYYFITYKHEHDFNRLKTNPGDQKYPLKTVPVNLLHVIYWKKAQGKSLDAVFSVLLQHVCSLGRSRTKEAASRFLPWASFQYITWGRLTGTVLNGYYTSVCLESIKILFVFVS